MTYSIKRPDNFDIAQIFDCGQCFRFSKHLSKNDTYCGVAFGRYLEITQTDNDVIFNCDKDTYNNLWHSFLDLDNNYSLYIDSFSNDTVLYEASKFSSGIRLLKQDPWETLCSFIISQNNNIPRIKGIIENMSKAYGESFECDGNTYYSFPTAKALYDAGTDAIFALKTGFRAKYIYDAASKVAGGELDLNAIFDMPLDDAMQALMTIKGVGPKVASCVLLFGFSKYDAFPIDVWVKKILKNYYSEGMSPHFTGKHAGIAQQYLFYYERCKNNVYL
ncbi:MAG: DNA-3-methyladenine glycosylase 2 family protein [Ruminococcaceae bacterium]|nr:DNA-3-methyladenine glycosylase 2 family protein [Oscillospiraceae bacterium]